ncbi:hypothetical protein [Pontibacter fetidus]|uniref:YD repeat-containing protein n=1 Tax=Pontibacter fetidus TaxID=2700082 RepID=A0A6B2HC49_9BACT|nr:hypothetical protein [Pontibacter fetidus]NDK57582.1 hypothetical protein [Pontibacter fetidus]
MKKLLLLMLCFWLIACSKKDADNPTPAKEQTCTLQETAATTPTGNTNSKYIYDSAGKIIKVEYYEKGALTRYTTFAYNNKQLIENESIYQADGTLTGFNNYSYDGAGLLIQMNSNQLTNGTMQPGFIYSYEYVSDKQVAKRTIQYPDGRLYATYTYEYEGEEMRRILTFTPNGQHAQTLTLHYDDKQPALKNTPALQKIGFLMIGYPYLHNIVSYSNISSSGQVWGDSYTATYEYNAAGHPIKSTRTMANGSQLVATLTYQCK